MTKVLVSLPDDLLAGIDREARQRGTSRSRFLADAARHELRWPDPERIAAALARGREALSGLGPFESADVIREQRQARDAVDRRRQ